MHAVLRPNISRGFSALLTALGVLIAAMALAVASAWWLMRHPPSHVITSGAWRTNSLAGSADADLYSRAYIAVTALFALNWSETIYFEAVEDDDHEPLLARCTYAIAGKPIDARWWSITAYGDDNFLIPNDANRFSFTMSNLKYGPDGAFRVIAAPVPQAENWLPTGLGDGGFNLLIRLYNPGAAIVADPGAARLPSIKRVGACS